MTDAKTVCHIRLFLCILHRRPLQNRVSVISLSYRNVFEKIT